MPELPEVETTRQGITPHIIQQYVTQVVIRQHKLRWPIDKNLPSLLKKQQLTDISRRGKYLLLSFNQADKKVAPSGGLSGTLLVHLGMSGSLRIINSKQDKPKKHDHVDIHFNNGLSLRFHDPRRFGCMLWTEEEPEQHKLLSQLGPEPLNDEFSAEYLFKSSRKRKKDVKTFIMDSHIVVGVGNIYANESLFSSGIRPTKAAGKLTRKQCELWVEEIKVVLQRSITQGGTTLRDFVGSDGEPGYFAQQLNVYGRANEPCVNCAQPLKEIRQAQRSSVFCRHCQK